MTELAGATVLITGAASGLGRLLTFGCVERGGRVVAWDIDGVGLAKLAQDLPGAIEPYIVDVADRRAVSEGAAEVIATVGRIDILVLNAGVVSGGRLLQLPDDAIERVMNVNAVSLFWCVKAFLPAMVERDSGHIVTIASIAALAPFPGLTDYVASKHAAYGFADALRTELADDAPGVRTTVVLPQVLDTGMFAGVSTPAMFPPVDPQQASDIIWEGVRRNRQRILLHRPAALTAYLLRPLPPRAVDALNRLFGGFDLMRGFGGRSVRADRSVQLVDE